MASVNYTIKGKYDPKGVKEAEKGFQGLQNSVKKINGLISAFAGLKVIQTIKAVASETQGIFQNQNKALVQFNTAVAKTNLNLSKLQAVQDKVSRKNFFDGDSINNAMQMAMQMGVTEDQIEKVMTAATDMAASGIMPLDTAVKALSMSYSGNVTQLKKIAPELNSLTADELKNGAAVDALAGKYAGFGDALSSTFSGRNTQWQNSIDDLKASIGSIPASLQFITQGKLLEPLNKVTEWIVKNRNYIINFFLNLPEVGKTVFNSLKQMLSNMWQNLPQLIQSLGPILVDMWKNSITTWISIVKEAFNGIRELLDFAISNPFVSKGRDYVNTFLNNIIEGINKLPDKLPEWVKKLFGVDENTEVIKFRFKTDNADNAKTWEQTAKNISASISRAAEAYKSGGEKSLQGFKDALNELSSFMGDDTKALADNLKKILGKDLPEELQKALDGVVYNASGATTTKTINDDGLDKDIKKSLLDSAGQIGSYIKAFQENGFTGVGMQIFNDIISKLASQSEIISNVLNIVDYFVDQFALPLIEILEPILAPVLSVVKSIGSIIASALPIITPLIDFIAEILKAVAGVIFWLKTLFSSIFDTIAYGFQLVENGLIKIYNALNGWGQDKAEKSYAKSWDQISRQWKSLFNPQIFKEEFNKAFSYNYTGASVSSSSGGSGASYTAAKDVIVNVNYNHSFVNGDAREIAVQIYKEFKSAERLGYV